MDIENLSKTDLILTAVFISFVTAIVTGIVVIFLMEDAPKDIIRERIIPSEASTTTDNAAVETSTSATGSESTSELSTPSRDEILDAAVRAVARITAETTAPQAGVLVDWSGSEVIVTAATDYPASAQALFEDGTVADLEGGADVAGFSTLSITAAGDRVYPLQTSSSVPEVGESAFVVPLSAQPEIVRVSITAVSGSTIQTSASALPATSLLMANNGQLIGLYRAGQESFQFIGQIEDDM